MKRNPIREVALTIILDGTGLTIEKLERIARHGEKVEIAPAAIERMKACRAMLEKKIKAHEIMYGVNTGIGEFSEVVLNDDQVKDFQRYLIYNHAAGIGDPAPLEYVRAAMAATHQRSLEGTLGKPPRNRAHVRRDAQQGGCPVRLPEGLRRRVGGSRPDVADRAAPPRRGPGLLQGRAPRGSRSDESAPASRFPGSRRATASPRSTARTSSPP